MGDIEARISEWFAAQPGFDAFEVNRLVIRRQGKRSWVDILLDRKSGSITLDDCGRWNRALSDFLETADLFQGPYVVEIASPGADRPLVSARDFERVLSRRLKVRYRDETDSVKEFAGVLDEAGASGIRLRSDRHELRIPLDRIEEARQEITFSKETNRHGA